MQGNAPLSCKIFLGGVPWDITEQTLISAFKPFGNIKIEWPNRDANTTPKGYLYIIFEHEKQVRLTIVTKLSWLPPCMNWYKRLLFVRKNFITISL